MLETEMEMHPAPAFGGVEKILKLRAARTLSRQIAPAGGKIWMRVCDSMQGVMRWASFRILRISGIGLKLT